MISIDYDMIILREENSYVAYCPELDISSCGHDVQHAKDMLKTSRKTISGRSRKIGNQE